MNSENGEEGFPGVKVVKVDGGSALAFASRTYEQADIERILEFHDVVGVLFYYAIFKGVDFSILKDSSISQLSFLHGNFGDKELSQLEGVCGLRSLKLHDTKVTDSRLEQFKVDNPLVEIK